MLGLSINVIDAPVVHESLTPKKFLPIHIEPIGTFINGKSLLLKTISMTQTFCYILSTYFASSLPIDHSSASDKPYIIRSDDTYMYPHCAYAISFVHCGPTWNLNGI